MTIQKEKIKLTEWLGLTTLITGVYCYSYGYLYWKYFGIEAYNYFSYLDALQRAIPLLLLMLFFVNVLLMVFYAVFIFANTATVRYFKVIRRLHKYNAQAFYLKVTMMAFMALLVFSFFHKALLEVDWLGYFGKILISFVIFATCLSFISASISQYFVVLAFKKRARLKYALLLHIISPIPFQILAFIFIMPTISAYVDEHNVKAQAIIKTIEGVYSYKMLALTKDYVFLIDNKNIIIRKVADLDYIYYPVTKVK